MSQSSKRIGILAAAVATALAVSSASQAQYRVDTGNVMDVNPRVGSGGLNTGGDSRVGRGQYSGVTGNDIVTGNVTAGKQFRGFVPYSEARAFRGNLSSRQSDVFVRDSSGTPYGGFGGYNSNANTVRPFYGDSRAVPPPPGFVRPNYGATGYIPGPLVTQRVDNDLRLGQVLDSTTVRLPQPGQTVLPGPVDPQSYNNTLITASSLYGVRQWNAGNEADQQFVSRYANALGENYRAALSDLEVGAMRREMQQAAGGLGRVNNDTLAPKPLDSNVNQNQPAGTDPNLAKPLPQPLESPVNAPLPANALPDSLQSNPLPGDLNTEQQVRARLLVPPAQQSKANAMLQERLQQQRGGAANEANNPMSAAQEAQKFNQDLMQARKAQEKKGGPGQRPAGAPGAPAGGNAPGAKPAEQTPPAAVPGPSNPQSEKSAPPKITSFSEGFKAKGPAEILKKAEGLMKDGKWYSAIEQFDLASQVAPNNMLIVVGRANAELGGSYYARAETDLRKAFTEDPAMLEGTYDLRGMIGDERLNFLVTDLKDINQKNPTQPRPMFLLAYIMYNTDNPRMAAGYLDLAEKRAGANDPFYSLIRKHWVLPSKDEAPAPDLNK